MSKIANPWTRLSSDFANQRNYLDELFKVYPVIPDGIREVCETSWQAVEHSFAGKNNIALLQSLLELDLFPIKDSYVAYFRRDRSALERNPTTVDRLCGRLYEMGLEQIYLQCSQPKETNRQIGPLFRRWLQKGVLGVSPVKLDEFVYSNENAVLDASDTGMRDFARQRLNYRGSKGLDFVARFNGQYVIGEAKFLTDFGGHQMAQFNDAVTTLTAKVNAITVAILDGVLYIEGGNKMYRALATKLKHRNVMSALVLRDFLYQI